MSYPHHEDHKGCFLDVVHDTIVADPNTVSILTSGESFCPGRPWVFPQGIYAGLETGLYVAGEFPEGSGRFWTELDGVSHSKTQFSFEGFPRHILPGLLEGFPRFLQVHAVFQLLKNLQVLDRDDGCHVLAPAVQDDALTRVSHSI